MLPCLCLYPCWFLSVHSRFRDYAFIVATDMITGHPGGTRPPLRTVLFLGKGERPRPGVLSSLGRQWDLRIQSSPPCPWAEASTVRATAPFGFSGSHPSTFRPQAFSPSAAASQCESCNPRVSSTSQGPMWVNSCSQHRPHPPPKHDLPLSAPGGSVGPGVLLPLH